MFKRSPGLIHFRHFSKKIANKGFGFGFFVEGDGVEGENILEGCLGLGAQYQHHQQHQQDRKFLGHVGEKRRKKNKKEKEKEKEGGTSEVGSEFGKFSDVSDGFLPSAVFRVFFV